MEREVEEAYMPFGTAKTYYRIVHPNGKKDPLIFLHGGPGSTHNYFESFDELAEIVDRPFVMYDQIGCGLSDYSGGPELFNAETWMNELAALREYLHLDNCHLFGQSWGGMLEIAYMIERKPKGVKSVILSSTLPAAHLWKEEQFRRISYLNEEDREAFYRAEKTGDFQDPAYLEALDRFMEKYCASAPKKDDPEYMRRKKIGGRQAYVVAWGENECMPTGTLAGFDYTERLNEISVPTLITSGQMDLCSPFIAKTMLDRLPNAQWELFQYSRHMPYIDEKEKYHDILLKWLAQFD
ncbi:alpha/beta fold hydrolase [Atopobacter sp. AH10]|uniref:proline iminopeptidase n=1 Tax=Atopobacter sp. AH10 TaxID=2315861 RepID=UPI000EF268B9|nr:proline iminopeptidase-family hydrolase [Atopobacter sp. AH10]RLK63309.1 alpha/beta fold hydrolase [Atopobacter sp. AH10]